MQFVFVMEFAIKNPWRDTMGGFGKFCGAERKRGFDHSTHVCNKRTTSSRRLELKCSSSLRYKRVQKVSDEVDEVLLRAEADGPLASYDLQGRLEKLNNTVRPDNSLLLKEDQSNLLGSKGLSVSESSSSSSSSSSSDNENDTEDFGAQGMVRTYSHRSQPKGIREGALSRITRTEIRVCTGKSCRKKGSENLLNSLQQYGSSGAISCKSCKCLDQCKRGPALEMHLPNGERKVFIGVNSPQEVIDKLNILLQ